jgi:hypothetical protein
MRVKEVTIKEVDLFKIMNEKGIKDLNQLARVSGVGREYLRKCANGYITMGTNTWNKLKQSL